MGICRSSTQRLIIKADGRRKGQGNRLDQGLSKRAAHQAKLLSSKLHSNQLPAWKPKIHKQHIHIRGLLQFCRNKKDSMDATSRATNQQRDIAESVATARFFGNEEGAVCGKEESGGSSLSSFGMMNCAAGRKGSVISQKFASSSQLESMGASGTAVRTYDQYEATGGDEGMDTLRRWGSAEGRFAILDER